MSHFRPQGLFYRCLDVIDSNESALTLSSIEPPKRSAGTPQFDEKRMRDIFRAFTTDTPLPPIEVIREVFRQQYRYRVRNGLHRFYASAAVGFTCIPVAVVEPPFVFETESI
jgi:hypothetical protein